MFEHFFSKATKRKMEQVKFQDVELVSEGVTIPFHKLILAIHSRYFRVIFSMNGFQEMDRTKVEITSISPKTINSIKTFLYSGEVKVTRKNIKKLLEAFTFLMINDGYGKLDDAMDEVIDDVINGDIKIDDYEERLWMDYCVLNSLNTHMWVGRYF